MTTRVQQPEQTAVPATIHLLRLLGKLLVLAYALPEMRFGLNGFSYPAPTFGIMNPTGAPYFIEVVTLGILALFALAFLVHVLRIKSRWYHGVATIMIVFSAMSMIIGNFSMFQLDGSQFGQARFVFESMILFIVIASVPWRQKDFVHIIWAFSAVGVFHAITLILSYVLPYSMTSTVFTILPSIPVFRYAGLFSQPSRASVILTAIFMMQVPFILPANPIRMSRRVIAGGVALLIFVGLWIAQTRASYLAIAAAGAVFMYEQRKNRVNNFMLVFIAGFMLFLVLTSFGLLEVGLSRFSEVVETSSTATLGAGGGIDANSAFDILDESRGYIWEVAFQAMTDYPLGMGFGALFDYSGDLRIPHAHNMFLQWGVQFGFVGLLLLMYLIVRSLAMNRIKIQSDEDISSLLMAVRLAVISYLVSGIFEPFLNTNSGPFFWLMLGLIVANYEKDIALPLVSVPETPRVRARIQPTNATPLIEKK